jgi:heat-inducible transcriptional repressor
LLKEIFVTDSFLKPQKITDLNDRQHAILSAVVQTYVLTAESVGARTIAKQSAMQLSPATIRNAMSDLEEMGFLSQPHTSAGRIPTDKGYRYYVDFLMNQVELTHIEKDAIAASMAHAHDVDKVLEISSQVLGRITHQLGVALSPRFEEAVFKKMDFLQLSSNRILLALSLESGIVKTLSVELNTDLSVSQIATICSIVNERFQGRPITELQKTGKDRLSGMSVDENSIGIIRLFIPSVEQLFESTSQINLYTAGTSAMLSQPEFIIDKTMLSALMELLDDKKVLIHLLSRHEHTRGMVISIGGENEEGQFKSFSVVASSYKVGNTAGTLGVIGPTRMPYPKLISAVDYMAKVLEEKHKNLLKPF